MNRQRTLPTALKCFNVSSYVARKSSVNISSLDSSISSQSTGIGQVAVLSGISPPSLFLHSPIISWEDFRSFLLTHSCLVSCHFMDEVFSLASVVKRPCTIH